MKPSACSKFFKSSQPLFSYTTRGKKWNKTTTNTTVGVFHWLRSLTWSLGECCCWAPSCCEAVPGLCSSWCLPPGHPDWPGNASAWSSSAGWLECRARGGRKCRHGVVAEAGAAGETWTDHLDCWAALRRETEKEQRRRRGRRRRGGQQRNKHRFIRSTVP